MFAPEYRLRGKKSFEKVKDGGKLFQSEDFGICVLRRKDKDVSRFGVVVSTKISKIAVHRNRIKRAFREGIRHNISRIPPGYDMVFLIKKSIINKRADEIMKQVDKFFQNRKFVK